MNTSYVNWFEIFVCILFCCCVECRPDVNFSKHYEETEMHPSRIMPRSKRIKFFLEDHHEETSSEFWQKRAKRTLYNHLNRKNNENVAKNVIFFLGDGMSIPTITAARIYLGQLQNRSGEESSLSFESFPHIGLSKTYCIDKQVADSACSATAYLGGVKANFNTIGVNGRVPLNDCDAARNPRNHVDSVLALAQRAGKRTGIVTTTTVTHASPAATYAHKSNRLHECDGDVVAEQANPHACEDIAYQLVHKKPGKGINVIFGGGRTKFLGKSVNDTEGNQGERDDEQDLIAEWQKDKKNARVIFDREGLNDLSIEDTDHVLGLFSSGHMDYNLDADREKQPSLVDMTEIAIRLLRKNDDGYFLFVEGGRIDHAHHTAKTIKALDETVQFDNAIRRAVEMTHQDDTLIIVTADHAHTMSMSGYPDRGAPITGLNTQLSDVDDLPYLTLSYANGPGFETMYEKNGSRKNLTGIMYDSNFTYPGLYPTLYETHGGDDVSVYALGCMSHLFTGVYEQNTIPHLIRYASCLDDGLTACS